jgi:hypothetical protein
VTLPKASLHQGTWFKLICGASFHHLPSIRELAFLYTLAGPIASTLPLSQLLSELPNKGSSEPKQKTRKRDPLG